MSALKRAFANRSLTSEDILADGHAKYQYGVITANIYSSLSEAGLAKSVVVTAVNRIDGSAEAALNIAVQMNNENKHALFIDCDFENPILKKVFGRTGKEHAESFTECIEQLNVGKFSLSVICAESVLSMCQGKFTEKAMRTLIEEIGREYDYVIFNFPALKDDFSTVTYAKNADGMLFVINKLTTKKKAFEEVLLSIANIDVRVLGAMFIDVK